MSGRAQTITAIGQGPSLYPTAIVSSKDQAAHTKLKYREGPAQAVSSSSSRTGIGGARGQTATSSLLDEEKAVDVSAVMQQRPLVSAEVMKRYDDSDAIQADGDSDTNADEPTGKKQAQDSDSSDPGDSDSDADSDSDDELELQAELERIKAERAEAIAKQVEGERQKREAEHKSSAMKSNPLVDLSVGGGAGGGDGSAKIKRRWNDDVVFRNQARDEPDIKRRFINDTIRSDFHKAFLKRFIK